MSRDLFKSAGKRLYLTVSERTHFLAAADREERQVRTFCYVLAHTGCRNSDALRLVGERIGFDARAMVHGRATGRRVRGPSPRPTVDVRADRGLGRCSPSWPPAA